RMDEIEASNTAEESGGNPQSRTDQMREVIDTVLDESPPTSNSKEHFRAILHSVFIHKEMSVPVACKHYNVDWYSVYVYTDKIRNMLITPDAQLRYSLSGSRKKYEEVGSITVDGITVPRSYVILCRLLMDGTLDFTQSRPFEGTRDELRTKILQAVCRFNTNVSAVWNHWNVAKIFINFAKSPCTLRFRLAAN
ncbi:hypothetical protein PFISCL1PPCAC_956, partial [Pristionchus fissidentatus]